MAEPSLHTTDLHGLLDRGRKGDRAAYDQLLRRVGYRLERLARAMLRRYPEVHRHADTGDVVQGALLRLMRALRSVEPPSMRDFYRLAAEQIRRELIDLARHYKNHVILREQDLPAGAVKDQALLDVADAGDGSDLDSWCALHEAVERLPTAEREVFSLTFYHGWTQQQIADLLQVTDRQVRRHWNAALLTLGQELQDVLPTLLGEHRTASAVEPPQQ